MAFADEIEKLQRRGRAFLRLTTTENPLVAALGDRRWGKVPDNTGTVPIKGTVVKFGTYSRTLVNIDQGFEVPSISVELIDDGAEWRKLGAEPWKLYNRWAFFSIRLEDDTGAWIDSDVCWGQITNLRFPPGRVTFTISLLPGESLGKTIPRRVVTKDDWPNAHESAVGQPIPIHYGKRSNIEPSVLGLSVALDALAGDAPTGLTATAGAGGTGVPATTSYYAICEVNGGVMGPLSAVANATTDSTNKKITLAWDAISPEPDGIRVFRASDPAFLQFERYRVAVFNDDLAGSATGLVDNYPGRGTGYLTESTVNASPTPTTTTATVANGGSGFTIGNQVTVVCTGGASPGSYVRTLIANTAGALEWTPALPQAPATDDVIYGEWIDTHWDLQYRWLMQYYVSAMVGGSETKMSGPVTVLVTPQIPRTAVIDWTAYPSATAYKVRRKKAVHHWGAGWDREWTVTAPTVTLSDTMGDTSSVTIPASALQSPGGAVRGLFVDTNPSGATGQFCYLFSGAVLGAFLQVYVKRTASTAAGGSAGSVEPPTAITATVEGTPGTKTYVYAITSFNARGESKASEDVIVTTGPDTLDGFDYIHLTWAAVEGAEGYDIYGRTGDKTRGFLKSVDASTLEYFDFGIDTPVDEEHAPHHDQSSEAAEAGLAAPEPEHLLMTENVDYYVEERTTNGNLYHIVRFVADHENPEVTANIEGYTADADGSGAYLDNPVDCLYHFLLNWVFNSYRSGAFYTDTDYRSGLLDAASFAAAATVADTRGYVAAGSLTELTDPRALIQEWAASFGLDIVQLASGSFGVEFLEIPDPLDVDALPQIDPNVHIFRDTFECSLDDRIFNRIPYRAGPTLDGGHVVSGEQKHDTSIADYDWEYPSEIVELRWTTDAATALDVITRRLQRLAYNISRASFYVPLRGLNYPVATLVAVTHWDGLAANTDGWVQRVCRVVRSDIDFDKMAVRVEVEDVSSLVEAMGVRFGDRTWDAADRSFTTAAAAKQARYLYLADRTTGQFSDGSPGKRLGLGGPFGSGTIEWTEITDYVLDQLATFQDMNELVHNVIVVKEFPKAVALGGDFSPIYETTSFVTVQGAQVVAFSGEHLGAATYEIWFMGEASSGDTVTVQFLDTLPGPDVVLVTKTFTNTTPQLVKSAAFTLPAAAFEAVIQVKSTAGSPFRAYGFQLIQR